MKNRNNDILQHMLKYCEKINNLVKRFGNGEKFFLNDEVYRDAACLSLMQIGELSGLLSDDFKKTTEKSMDWIGMKKLRNLVVHAYHQVNFSTIWNVVMNNIPKLQRFCEEQIHQYNLTNQEADEPEYDDEDLEM